MSFKIRRLTISKFHPFFLKLNHINILAADCLICNIRGSSNSENVQFIITDKCALNKLVTQLIQRI